MGEASDVKDLEARKGIAQAVAAIFAAIAGAGFGGVLPPPNPVPAIAAGVALVALVAAWRFSVEIREAGQEVARRERDRQQAAEERTLVAAHAQFARCLLTPVAAVKTVNPTLIGIDRAEQTILEGGAVPAYVTRSVDEVLRAQVAAALDGEEPWIVIVLGSSKVGKSRALFEALRACDVNGAVKLVAPRDSAGLQTLLASDDALAEVGERAVLWLDDIEPFLNAGVTLATLRLWRAGGAERIVAATYGGKGRELIAGAVPSQLATLATSVLQNARQITLTATADAELEGVRERLSRGELAAVRRYGLAAYVVAAPLLGAKLGAGVHPGDADASPGGVAVVRAAADWARCGRTDPIGDETLRELWPHYLPAGVQASDEHLSAAIAWALRPVAGSIALLHHAGELCGI